MEFVELCLAIGHIYVYVYTLISPLRGAHDLEVVMFFEILTHLPGKYLETFANINDQSVARNTLDEFLVRNMPNAEKIFAIASSKFRHFYVGKPRRSLFEILKSDLEFQ